MNLKKNLNLLRALLLITFFSIASPVTTNAQMKMMIQSDGEIFMIAELGAVLLDKDGKIEVAAVMPADRRMKAYRKVDMLEGDIIMMLNGKRMKEVTEFKTLFESLSADDEINIGIKRGKDMKIISFSKADPKNLPKMNMVMLKDDGEGGGDVDVIMLEGSGLMFEEKKKITTVSATMPHADKLFGEGTVKVGDLILKYGETKITSALQLSDLYESAKIGESVSLVFARDGKEFTVKFDKPKMKSPEMNFFTN